MSRSLCLYESLLLRRFEHQPQLQPGCCQLLLLRVVGAVQGALPAGQVDEDDQGDEGHEHHAPSHGGDDQGGQGVRWGVSE